MVISLRATISVEIGVYGGRSFFGLALAHKAIAHGLAIGIDPWSNEAATEGYEGENLAFWKVNPLPQIHEKFMRTIYETGCQNVVKIFHQKSDAVDVPPVIDILHVDGQHSEQACRDVKRFAVAVRYGGFVVMDDTGWKNGEDAPVQRAVTLLGEIGFRNMYPLGTGEVFQRLRMQ